MENLRMPDPAARIDTTNVRRLTAHCRKCQHVIGEFRGNSLVVGGVRIFKRVQVHCVNCGHYWYENAGGCYDGDVPRTSGG